MADLNDLAGEHLDFTLEQEFDFDQAARKAKNDLRDAKKARKEASRELEQKKEKLRKAEDELQKAREDSASPDAKKERV